MRVDADTPGLPRVIRGKPFEITIDGSIVTAHEGETIAFGTDVLTIGRSPHSDLFLDDVTVSRHHARVIKDENGYLIEDLNSLNGTYVNRKRIERHRLLDGDELQIGKFKLAFFEPSESAEEVES